MAGENGRPYDEAGLVAYQDACPGCGERSQDLLIWIDSDRVECQTCKGTYQPRQEVDDGID